MIWTSGLHARIWIISPYLRSWPPPYSTHRGQRGLCTEVTSLAERKSLVSDS
ncbi:Hypothetical predicted protein, partial [Marmota monax]